jgi:hypothetical protein
MYSSFFCTSGRPWSLGSAALQVPLIHILQRQTGIDRASPHSVLGKMTQVGLQQPVRARLWTAHQTVSGLGLVYLFIVGGLCKLWLSGIRTWGSVSRRFPASLLGPVSASHTPPRKRGQLCLMHRSRLCFRNCRYLHPFHLSPQVRYLTRYLPPILQ